MKIKNWVLLGSVLEEKEKPKSGEVLPLPPFLRFPDGFLKELENLLLGGNCQKKKKKEKKSAACEVNFTTIK